MSNISFVLFGSDSSLTVQTKLFSNQESFNLTLLDCYTHFDYDLKPISFSNECIFSDIGITIHRNIQSDVNQYFQEATTAGLIASRNISLESGNAIVAGNYISCYVDRMSISNPVNLSLSGKPAEFRRDIIISAESDTYEIVTKECLVLRNYIESHDAFNTIIATYSNECIRDIISNLDRHDFSIYENEAIVSRHYILDTEQSVYISNILDS